MIIFYRSGAERNLAAIARDRVCDTFRDDLPSSTFRFFSPYLLLLLLLPVLPCSSRAHAARSMNRGGQFVARRIEICCIIYCRCIARTLVWLVVMDERIWPPSLAELSFSPRLCMIRSGRSCNSAAGEPTFFCFQPCLGVYLRKEWNIT